MEHKEVYNNVRVIFDKETNYLYIEDPEDGRQLALYYVEEED